jgi:hypothetical protein
MTLLTQVILRWLVVIGVVTAPLSACDDSDGEQLSDDQFVEQANQICADGAAEIDELGGELGDDPSDDELRTYYLASIDNLRGQLDDIAALQAPDDKVDPLQALIDDAEGILDELEDQVNDDVDAVTSPETDPFAEINQRFTDLGLTVCAS